MKDDFQKVPDFVDNGFIWASLNGNTAVGIMSSSDGLGAAIADIALELSECPCDPRRRHERLGQKVAVV